MSPSVKFLHCFSKYYFGYGTDLYAEPFYW